MDQNIRTKTLKEDLIAVESLKIVYTVHLQIISRHIGIWRLIREKFLEIKNKVLILKRSPMNAVQWT